MKYGVVYVVMNEGEVVFASIDKGHARKYANEKQYEARREVLEEWDNDDPTEKDIVEADFQAGYDGGCFEVVKIDISSKEDDDTVELPDGNEIDVSELVRYLDANL